MNQIRELHDAAIKMLQSDNNLLIGIESASIDPYKKISQNFH